MTPAEAREIDRQEFEAECAAIRRRAYALLHNSPSPAPASPQQDQVEIKKEPVDPKPKLFSHAGRTMTLNEWAKHLGVRYQTLAHRLRQKWPIELVLTSQLKCRGEYRPNAIIEHNGKAMSIAEWAKYLGLKHNTLYARLMRGVPLNLALSPHRLPRKDKVKHRPGVSEDLSGIDGTGAGGSLQETSQMDFPEKTNSR